MLRFLRRRDGGRCRRRSTATTAVGPPPAEATVARLSVSGLALRFPENPEAFAASCKTLGNRVEEESDAGRLQAIAGALHRSVSVQRTNNGASGTLERVIPHGSERVEGDSLRIARTWA